MADPQHDDPQPRRLRATCPTWVASPYDGVFTDQAVAYYEERAKGGCGLIFVGGRHPSQRLLLAVSLSPAFGDDGRSSTTRKSGASAPGAGGTLDRVAEPKRVLVAGAGPRGVEFARVAAARGHDVAVLERAEEVGGHVRSFSRVPGRAPFHGIADWLATRWPMFGMETIPEVYFIWIQSKLYETGVELITDHFVE